MASPIIASFLITHSDIPPKWHDIPVIGLAGLIVAGVMSFLLVVSIIKLEKR